MFGSILRFELGYQLRGPVFIAIFLIFGLLTFGGVTLDNVSIGGTGAVNVNSPYAAALNMLIWSLFGMIIPTAFLSSGILRDKGFVTEEMFGATPVNRRTFMLARFAGGYLVTMLAFAAVPIFFLLGSVMPWLDPESVGPFNPGQVFYIFALFGIPNMLIIGMILFSVANFTRSTIATYVALVGVLIVYFIGNALVNDPELARLMALLDPLGLQAFGEVTRYWTAFERNTQVPPLEGIMLENRLLWLAIGVGLLLLNVFFFPNGFSGSPVKRKSKTGTAEEPFIPTAVQLPTLTPAFTGGTSRYQFWRRTRFETMGVVRNIAFWVLLALGIFNSLGGLMNLSAIYGTPSYPITRIMVDVLLSTFSIVPLIIAIYYAAELVWRERSVKFSEIIDATPAPNWVFVLSKFLAMVLVLAALVITSMLTAVLVQLSMGYDNLELGQYALRLGVDFMAGFTILAVIAIFAQVFFNNRWAGMIAMLVYLIGTLVLFNLGFEDGLFIPGSIPGAPYSDMNGYGHYLGITAWWTLYWGFFGVFLIVLTYLLWSRGALESIGTRIAGLPGQFRGGAAIAGSLALIGFVATGAWIYNNTHIRNTYFTSEMGRDRAEAYERTWGEVDTARQPKITDVDVALDIFPSSRAYDVRIEYMLENKTDAPISEVHIDYAWGARLISQEMEGARLTTNDPTMNHYVFTTNRPMQPGERLAFTAEIQNRNPGFRNAGNQTTTNYNGTFIPSGESLPGIGINPGKFLANRQQRRQRGLPPQDRIPKLEDESQWSTNALRGDSDWVTFAATVSTEPDQIAMAPGYLEREWTENGRRYFRYVMDAPIQNFYSFLSARYEVAEDTWRDVDLQVLYHPEHGYNVERMMQSMKDSFDYFTEAFSAYQYRQMRILEFPAYATFAQSFPNTVPYSESIGFIADLRDKRNLDYVYYVTSHEMAHQWWGHQLSAANVQGVTMLIETFSQYAALMVMEQEYGEEHMRRFLKWELDSYLRGRGVEARAELPLYRVENQGYIHYRKGSLVMYALKDYVGEDVVNRSQSRMLNEWAYKSDPYPRSVDYLRILREEAGPEHDQLITDLFEKIMLWDMRVENATTTQNADGSWDVSLIIEARKLEANDQGAETEVSLDMMIDVGLFSENLRDVYEGTEHILSFGKQRIVSGTNEFTFTVAEQPQYAGIDPYNKLVDRNSDDNLRRVDVAE
ncbi:MAG: hypothetical protein MRY59_07060 [Aquisalinus sp.]|nr:hypothetical protein [Aquisalinus sp.]